MATSERLQLKALKRSHPDDFEEQFCVISFPDESRYAVVSCKSLVDPPSKLTLLTLVVVKDGSGKHRGILMHTGSEKSCYKKSKALEMAMTDTTVESDDDEETCALQIKEKEEDKKKQEKLSKKKKLSLSSGSSNDLTNDFGSDHEDNSRLSIIERETEEELKKLDKLKKKHEDEPKDITDQFRDQVQNRDGNQWSVVVSKLNHIINLLENRDQTYFHTPPPKKVKSETDVTVSPSDAAGTSSSSSSLVYKGFNLLSISSGGDPRKFGLKVFTHLFTKDEMGNGMIGPIERVKTKGKVELERSRVELLKKAIALKFNAETLNKKWPSIRQSCNQKCLDTKKSLCKQEPTLPSYDPDDEDNQDQ